MVEQDLPQYSIFLRDLLLPFKGNIGEKIQLSLWQIILKKQDILEKQKIEVFGGAGYVTYTPCNYLILQVARQSFQKFFPDEYKQLKSIKEKKDKFIFVKNLVDKRLHELDNKK